MKKKKLFVLSIDISLIIATLSLFAFTNHLLILVIMAAVMYVAGGSYICARKKYLKN